MMNTPNFRYLLAALLLPLSALSVAAAENPQATARAKTIAPFLDEMAVGLLRVDLTRMAVEPLFDEIRRLGFCKEPELADARATAAKMHADLIRAGVKDVYLVLTLARGICQRPFLGVIPLNPQSQPRAIEAALIGRITCEQSGDVLLVEREPEAIADAKRRKPDPRPELAPALEAVGDMAAQLLVLPPKHFQRALEETMPVLPEAIGGGPIRVFSRGVRWIAVGLDGPPRPSLRVVIQSDGAAAAEDLRAKVIDLARRAGQMPEVRQVMPNFGEIVAPLTPQVEGNRLVLVLDDKNQGLSKVLGLLAPALVKARSPAAK